MYGNLTEKVVDFCSNSSSFSSFQVVSESSKLFSFIPLVVVWIVGLLVLLLVLVFTGNRDKRKVFHPNLFKSGGILVIIIYILILVAMGLVTVAPIFLLKFGG